MPHLSESAAQAILPFIQKRIMLPVNPNSPPEGFKEGKFMIFIGGGNASGKTAVTNLIFDKLEREGFDRDYVAEFGSRIFEDILAHKLVQPVRGQLEKFLHAAASKAKADDRHDSRAIQKETGFLKTIAHKAFEKARDNALEVGAPVIVDYHMHDKEFVRSCVEAARSHGYECIMISPHVDAETIQTRLEHRRDETGRTFQFDKVIARHKQFAENLDAFLEMFDLSVILDNNRHFCPPTIVAVSHRGKTHIYDEECYEKVRQKQRLNARASGPHDLWRDREQTRQSPGRRAQSDSGTMGKGVERDQRAGEANASDGHFVRMIEQDLLTKLPRRLD